jgi:hypothetical protein
VYREGLVIHSSIHTRRRASRETPPLKVQSRSPWRRRRRRQQHFFVFRVGSARKQPPPPRCGAKLSRRRSEQKKDRGPLIITRTAALTVWRWWWRTIGRCSIKMGKTCANASLQPYTTFSADTFCMCCSDVQVSKCGQHSFSFPASKETCCVAHPH